MTTAEELKKLVEKKRMIIGSSDSIRKLKKGVVERVFMASNIPKDVEDDIRHNARISNAEVEKMGIPNDELGMIFKRTHAILSVAVLRD